MMIPRDRFRESLIQHMEATGITAVDLAGATGVSKGIIDKLRIRKAETTNVMDAVAIARHFGKTVEEFLDIDRQTRQIENLRAALSALDDRDLRVISAMIKAMALDGNDKDAQRARHPKTGA